MRFLILGVFVSILTMGCSFKEPEVQSSGYRAGMRTGFIPSQIRRQFSGKTFSLIDVVEMPKGAYTLDQTAAVRGSVEFLLEYPSFTATPCRGAGYVVKYTPQRRSATSLLKIVNYVNGVEIFADHHLVTANDNLNVAIFAEYAPLESFYERGELPSEFVETFMPSNQCNEMCPGEYLVPIRPVIFDIARNIGCQGCFWDGTTCNRTHPDKFDFFPGYFPTPAGKTIVDNLRRCEAVLSNADLKFYYNKMINETCKNFRQKVLLDEWYYVQHKVPFKAPVYTILDFSNSVLATAATQKPTLEDRIVGQAWEWGR